MEGLGDLVQIDTVHLVDPNKHTKKYIYTVIDLCSRLAYAKVYNRLSQVSAIETILAAKQYFKQDCGISFKFKVVQADNGGEFGYMFKDRLEAHGMEIRHSRPYRSNDNAHIERFNRTLRQECTGQYMSDERTLDYLQAKLDTWLSFYNTRRPHLSLQRQTPVKFGVGVLRRS